MEKYLLNKKGRKLYKEDIITFLEGKQRLINSIKASPVFTKEMENNNLDYFNKILDDLKLLTPEGEQLEDYQVIEFLKSFEESSDIYPRHR